MENLSKQPVKGILKNASSIERHDTQLNRQSSQEKDIKWDEMNILQTLHPPDKDYGHMKIEEPKTPFSYYAEDEDGEMNSDNEAPNEIDPASLAELITKKTKKHKSKFDFENIDDEGSNSGLNTEDDDEHFENETEEDRTRRTDFEQKRKKHYNEFQMVKLARKLLKEELEEQDDEEGESSQSANI